MPPAVILPTAHLIRAFQGDSIRHLKADATTYGEWSTTICIILQVHNADKYLFQDPEADEEVSINRFKQAKRFILPPTRTAGGLP